MFLFTKWINNIIQLTQPTLSEHKNNIFSLIHKSGIKEEKDEEQKSRGFVISLLPLFCSNEILDWIPFYILLEAVRQMAKTLIPKGAKSLRGKSDLQAMDIQARCKNRLPSIPIVGETMNSLQISCNYPKSNKRNKRNNE